MTKLASRRAFLSYLAASPALTPASRALAQLASTDEAMLESVDDAFNVFDFEPITKQKLTDAHYTYMAMGVDGGETLRANREGFSKLQIRARRLINVREINMEIQLFGTRHASPVVIAPCGTHKMFHPDGELAVARASASRNCLQMLSTVTTTSVEDVNQARGAPVWYQLYPTQDWRITEALVRRAEDSGCPVLVLTVDLPNSNREALDRFQRASNDECLACHDPGIQGSVARKPMFDGLDLSRISSTGAPHMDWDFVERLKNLTSMKVVLKGIVTHEDAGLALEHGIDGLVVSNHGGRAIDSRRATIDSLPEVIDVIAGRIPVLVDSGIRRGSDIFKALAIGADAVCIGRPYLWGLTAFGQQGVERVLDILNRELQIMMQQAGTPNLQAITQNALVQYAR